MNTAVYLARRKSLALLIAGLVEVDHTAAASDACGSDPSTLIGLGRALLHDARSRPRAARTAAFLRGRCPAGS